MLDNVLDWTEAGILSADGRFVADLHSDGWVPFGEWFSARWFVLPKNGRLTLYDAMADHVATPDLPMTDLVQAAAAVHRPERNLRADYCGRTPGA